MTDQSDPEMKLELSAARDRFTMDFRFAGADKLTKNRAFQLIAHGRMKDIVEYFLSEGEKQPHPKIMTSLQMTKEQAQYLMNDPDALAAVKEAGRKAMEDKLRELVISPDPKDPSVEGPRI